MYIFPLMLTNDHWKIPSPLKQDNILETQENTMFIGCSIPHIMGSHLNRTAHLEDGSDGNRSVFCFGTRAKQTRKQNAHQTKRR